MCIALKNDHYSLLMVALVIMQCVAGTDAPYFTYLWNASRETGQVISESEVLLLFVMPSVHMAMTT